MSETEQAAGILAVIERAVINPDIDVSKMMALLDMQERIMAKNAELSFNDGIANTFRVNSPRKGFNWLFSR